VTGISDQIAILDFSPNAVPVVERFTVVRSSWTLVARSTVAIAGAIEMLNLRHFI
jgi:hypothetical protein